MLIKFFDWILGRNIPIKPWHLQKLNWQVTEYELDGDLAESATNWLSVGNTAELLDQMVKEQHLIVFCYHNQEFAQADGIWFEMFLDYDLVFILTNETETLFAPLAQQYRKLSTSRIHDNQANQIIWQHDVMLPELIMEHKHNIMIISHDANSIFLIRQDE